MKRIMLTDSQLQQIINLRDSGMSWVKIEQQTEVARRIAKREYDEWYQKQSLKQIEEARKEVAAQEYRLHLDLLSHLASLLIDSLGTPKAINQLQRTDEVLTQFLATDIYQEYPSFGPRLGDRERQSRVTRMNELLFKSLRDHTQRKVPWEMLEKWKKARNTFEEDIEKMRNEIREILRNIVAQKPKLKDNIDKVYKDSDVLEYCMDGILVHMWLNDVMGKESKVTAVKGQSLTRQGTAWIVFHDEAPIQTQLTFNSEDPNKNVDLAKDIAEASNWAIKNIRLGKIELIEKLRKEILEMREATNKLETVLNPLVLRPIILNTRCDICPV
jgi:hypothetical protein